MRRLLGVAYGVETGDEPVVDAHREHGVDRAAQQDEQRRVAVDPGRAECRRAADPAQGACDRTGPDGGRQCGPYDSSTVGEQDDVRREDVEQALQVARLDRAAERLDGAPGLRGGSDPAPPSRGDMGPGPVCDPADRRRGLLDGFGVPWSARSP
ncbi:hypothetical protein GCM10010299_56380 [Streptomyces tanashiensis]|nr:hypothetical protein GCM10010299_56380 [Streptomyces tanashiensis]